MLSKLLSVFYCTHLSFLTTTSFSLRIVCRHFENIAKERKSSDKDYVVLYKPRIFSVWFLIVCWPMTRMRSSSTSLQITFSPSGCSAQTGFSDECVSNAYCFAYPLQLHTLVPLLWEPTSSVILNLCGFCLLRVLVAFAQVFSLFSFPSLSANNCSRLQGKSGMPKRQCLSK